MHGQAAGWRRFNVRDGRSTGRPRVAPPAKPSLSAVELVELAGPAKRKKETKDNPREGWEDGTPPPHRDLSGAGEEFV